MKGSRGISFSGGDPALSSGGGPRSGTHSLDTAAPPASSMHSGPSPIVALPLPLIWHPPRPEDPTPAGGGPIHADAWCVGDWTSILEASKLY